MENKTFDYVKYNTMEGSNKKRICGYFVVSDLHKSNDVAIRLRTEELVEEIEKHNDWILESIIWEANHKVDTNRKGLNTILEKAQNDDFDILLLHHVTLISRQGSKTFDFVLQLDKLNKTVYGIIDNIYSLDDLAESMHLTIANRKKYEEYRK